ncbi:hypothetical protein H7J07_06160 [Mycobacterium koreense]|uniref:Uncharacterized protein n=1 Tax=Mycolicibacillus koreensis TaxID=1069220 RepID=A0A7I7SBN9_9MYCO|nr:hypothetical protein [Mycolicibacillus koreensis]MCV7247811.1 hypothetical protein [Mycolicibacillus koreensis]OSC34673.1 hypothetical protein B8W67_05345 [Mycolicibacillus koreensis]BBY54198.1 hypothetical protein MKOR_14490 [Mycolicibacillus koreensis]
MADTDGRGGYSSQNPPIIDAEAIAEDICADDVADSSDDALDKAADRLIEVAWQQLPRAYREELSDEVIVDRGGIIANLLVRSLGG